MNPRVVAGAAVGVALLGGGVWYALRMATPVHTGGLCEGTPPPEVADLCAVQTAIDQLQLHEVRVLPTGQAWHKAHGLSEAVHRLAMTRLAMGRSRSGTTQA